MNKYGGGFSAPSAPNFDGSSLPPPSYEESLQHQIVQQQSIYQVRVHYLYSCHKTIRDRYFDFLGF